MSGLLKLDSEKLDATIGAVKRMANSEPIEAIAAFAGALVNSGDDNELIRQGIEAGKKFQGQFNELTETGVDKITAEIGKVYDISEYLKRLNVGEISNRDASVTISTIDPSSVMQ